MYARRLARVLCVVWCLAGVAAADEAHLMRWADIHGDTVVFTYEDDLWLVPASGGDWSSPPALVRAAYRDLGSPVGSSGHVGFRPVKSLP